MKKALALALAAGVCGTLTSVASAQTYSSTTTPVAILDTPTIDNSITVPDSFVLADVNVQINITHTFDADLDIVLLPPGGTTYVHLATDVGGGGDNFVNTIFDQQAATAITAGAAPFTGSFRPEGGVAAWVGTIPLTGLTALANLDTLIGTNSAGTWTLRIDDDAGGDVGTLNGWSVILQATNQPTPITGALALTPAAGAVGAVSLATVTVSPGQNPPSSGVVVLLDASAIDGGTNIALLDDGIAPDAAIDGIYSATLTVGPAAAPGPQTISFGISDDQARTGSGSAVFTVRPPAAANDLCDNAELIPNSSFPVVTGAAFISGNAAAIEQPMSCSTGGVNNAGYSVWYKFVAPANAGYRFSTSQNLATGNNVVDTVIAVYASADGTCATLSDTACDDDGGVGANGNELQSDLTTELVAGTTYYIQVSKWALVAPTDANTIGLYVDQFIRTGACCQGSTCSIVSEAECTTLGGSYLGNFSACSSGDGLGSAVVGTSAIEDISGTGTALVLGDDNFLTAPIGFSFPFYGTSYTDVFVGSNGLLTFGVGSAALA
ncbi:MAG: proprotein convertase P-domain-containing protein, partial [Phycisphaerales bacterium]